MGAFAMENPHFQLFSLTLTTKIPFVFYLVDSLLTPKRQNDGVATKGGNLPSRDPSVIRREKMKTTRVATALYMDFLLKEKGSFSKEEVMDATGIAASSFYLALSDFRCFLLEYRPYLELVVVKDSGQYKLNEINL